MPRLCIFPINVCSHAYRISIDSITQAAGYDLRTPAALSSTLRAFSDTIGLSYLSALHLNDSKAPFNSHRDLHQNIGLGFLGLSAFRNVVNEPAFEGLPMILETPLGDRGTEVEIWAREIK
jgi:AP endonuclease-1